MSTQNQNHRQNFILKVAENYHRNVESLFVSIRAGIVYGPQVKRITTYPYKGRYSKYSANYICAAAEEQNKQIVIVSYCNKRITIPSPPENLSSYGTDCCNSSNQLFFKIKKNTIQFYGLTAYTNRYSIVNSYQLPDGYAWRKDSLGLKIIRLSHRGDYHLSPSSQMNNPCIQNYILALNKNVEIREAQQKESKHLKSLLISANKVGFKVGFQDSINAGNCITGTESFCRKHKLNIKKYYSPIYLMRIKDSPNTLRRLKLAVYYGLKKFTTLNKLGV